MGGELVRLDTVTQSSRFIDQTLKTWLKNMDEEKRGEFVDALFGVLASTGAKTFDEIADNWYENALRIGKSLYRMDPRMRRAVRKTLWAMFKAGRKNLFVLRPRLGRRKKQKGPGDE